MLSLSELGEVDLYPKAERVMYKGSVFISNSGRGELSVYPRIHRAWVCIQEQTCPVITGLSIQGTRAMTEVPTMRRDIGCVLEGLPLELCTGNSTG